jgi:hypothetical protein
MKDEHEPVMDAQYFDHIRDLSRLARKFIEDNPGCDAKVQFNYPEGVMVIGTMESPLAKKFVTYNEDGRRMLEAMGAFEESKNQPTVFMVRAAITYMDEIEEEDEAAKGDKPIRMDNTCPYCETIQTGLTGLTGKGNGPNPGDVSLCADCGNISIFGEDMQLRVPSEEDIASFKDKGGWEKLEEASEMLKETIHRRKQSGR